MLPWQLNKINKVYNDVIQLQKLKLILNKTIQKCLKKNKINKMTKIQI